MTAVPFPHTTLADLVPGRALTRRAATWSRQAALVVVGAALVAVAGNVSIPLGFTPVPLSLATFAVLTVGAALGPARAAASLGLFAVAGIAGAPVFAGGGSGWGGASFGYVLGYVLAAPVAGALARRGGDRTVLRAAGLMVAGNLAIYAVGLPWLAASAHLGLGATLAQGLLPFIPGDAIKLLAAAGLLPAAWALVRRVTSEK